MSELVKTRPDSYQIIVNACDLEFIIENEILEIRRGPKGNNEKLFKGLLWDYEGDDTAEKVGNYLRSKKEEFEKRMKSNQLELFQFSHKNPNNFVYMKDSYIDIIVEGLKEHNGNFRTYK